MSDINLLPIEQREKEIKEKKKAFKKGNFKIELSQLEKLEKKEPVVDKDKNISKNIAQTQTFFLDSIRNGLNQIYKIFKKSKRETEKPSILPEKESNKQKINYFSNHLTDIKPREINKKNTIKLKEKSEEKKELVETNNKIREGIEKLSQVEQRKPSAIKLDINLVPGKFKVEASTKQRIKTLIIVTLVCLLITLAVNIALKQIVNKRKIETQKIDLEIQTLSQEFDNLKTNSQEISDFIALLKRAKKLIEQHIFWSQIIKILEDNTLQLVYYKDMDFDLQKTSVSLTAYAKDYQTLAEQMLIFQSLTDQITQIQLTQARLEEMEKENLMLISGGKEKQKLVNFNLVLKFKPEVLHQE